MRARHTHASVVTAVNEPAPGWTLERCTCGMVRTTFQSGRPGVWRKPTETERPQLEMRFPFSTRLC